jgi:hypothetical protein
MIKIFTHHRLAFLLLSCLAALLFVCSCGQPAPIPSYIHIDSVALHTSPAVDGTNSHSIPDAWVYVDDQLVGAFELPATIPVPNTGQHTVQVAGGIKENGSSAERTAYPFYTTWSENMNLVPKARITVSPVVAYVPSCHPFDWKEDFESGVGKSWYDTIGSDAKLRRDSIYPFEGHYCGSVYLIPSVAVPIPHFQAESATSFPAPASGQEVYLEVNYRCNNKFYLGLINNTNYSNIIYLTFNTTDVWKKMYVRLTDALAVIPQGGTYNVYFGMDKDPLVDFPEMHIDNIKLIH